MGEGEQMASENDWYDFSADDELESIEKSTRFIDDSPAHNAEVR